MINRGQVVKIPTAAVRSGRSTMGLVRRLLAAPCAAGRLNPRQCDFLSKLTRFLMVGGTGVLVNSLVLFFVYERAGLPLVAASALAVEIAIINNFLLNNIWTFRAKDLLLIRLAKFNLVSLVGLGITTATLWALATHLGLHYLVANIFGIGLATTWNFTVNLFWTWGWE